MSLFDKILNPLNHGEDLKKIASEYEAIANGFMANMAKAENDATELFNSRKHSLEILQHLESAINDIENVPTCLINGIKRALSSMALINNAVRLSMDKEAEVYIQNNTTNKILATTGTAGAVIGATGAPIAMAIATTFGTASTGAAISTLGGAAAANAALAWLGGGALAAGGGGIAAGATLLGWLGPIGWGIGVGASGILVIKSLRDKSKNDKYIEEIKNALPDIKKKFNYSKQIRKGIKDIQSYTNQYNLQIKDKLNAIINLRNHDFNDERFPKKQLFEAVRLAKFIGKLSNEYVNLSEYEQ